MKRNILLIVSWYPTHDNPIKGGFFRERAHMLSNYYNFNVLQVHQKLISPFNLFKFIKTYFSLIIKKDYLLENPMAYYAISYGIKDNKFLSLLPFFLHKKIKILNHFLLKKTYYKAVDFIKKNGFNPDLIYATSAQTCSPFAMYLSKSLNIPYAVSEHSNFSPKSLNKIDTKKSIENAGAVISISHDKTRQLLFSGLECQPVYVGNPVDNTKFVIKSEKDNSIKNLLVVASYNKRKDFETFFKAIQFVKSHTSKKFKVTVVGIGTEQEIINSFNKRILYYNIESMIDLFPFVSRDNIVKKYHQADLVVLTSIAEGMPNCVLEGLSCGLPVFSTICGGSEDLIDSKSGKLFHLQDYVSIGEGIIDFIEGRLEYDKNYIRNRVIENYGVKAYQQKMVKIFNRLFDGK